MMPPLSYSNRNGRNPLFKLVFGWLFFLSLNGQGQNLDYRLLKELNLNRNKTWDKPLHVVGKSAYFGAMAYPVYWGMRWLAKPDSLAKAHTLDAGAALYGTVALVWLSKNLVDRQRPFIQHTEFDNPYPEENGRSFPSGQTSLAFETATMIWLHSKNWKFGLPGMIWAGGVAYSRLHLAQHYPSDVAAGALIGTGSALATYHLNRWIWQAKRKKPKS